jgi:hypothetical protein
MEEQINVFEVDHIGRKTKMLGLAPEHEPVVEILDLARRMHGSLALYQVGVVDCEMKKLPAGDRAVTLTRLWSDTYTHHTNLGHALARYKALDDELNRRVEAEALSERKALDDKRSGDDIDREFRKLTGGDQ